MTLTRSIQLALAVVALAALTSCGATKQWTREGGAPPAAVDPGARFYVAVPEDGRYGTRVYEGSGRKTADAVVHAFGEHADAVAGRGPESDADALANARAQSRTHVLLPEIDHWEDRATLWSGRRDVLRVTLQMLRVPDGAVLDAIAIDGTSSWWTFGGDHPEDLLHRPLAAYAASLF